MFRSRLEARWAVFFDVLGLRWDYEPEKFDTDAGRYIPDFWIPGLYGYSEQGVYLEAKGPPPSEDELQKASDLQEQTGRNVLIFSGGTLRDGLMATWCPDSKHRAYKISLMQCPLCGAFSHIGTELPPSESTIEEMGYPHLFCHDCSGAEVIAQRYDIDRDWTDFVVVTDGLLFSDRSPALDIARYAARSARFESPTFSAEVKAMIEAVKILHENHIFGYPELVATLHLKAAQFSADSSCPRYKTSKGTQ